MHSQDCRLCGIRCGRAYLCEACVVSLPAAPFESCVRCASPCGARTVCGACLRDPPPLDATVAALEYRWPVDGMVHGLKYRHELGIAALLGALLAQRAAGAPRPAALVPVPMTRRRLRERGFNQSAEIAREIGRRLALPVRIDVALRVGERPAQATLPSERRAANVAGVFEACGGFIPTHVALVDDVMTSGATLFELARTLIAGGAERVDAWVVARTPAA